MQGGEGGVFWDGQAPGEEGRAAVEGGGGEGLHGHARVGVVVEEGVLDGRWAFEAGLGG